MITNTDQFLNDVKSTKSALKLDAIPDVCSVCNHACNMEIIASTLNKDRSKSTMSENFLQIVLRCPRRGCRCYSVAKYEPVTSAYDSFKYVSITPVTHRATIFQASVAQISPEFYSIYSQSEQAENLQLDKIAGGGYRKALEFLIKDYAIKNNPDKKKAIEGAQLGLVINDYVTEARVLEVSKRAVWLGNDETHYTRKWAAKDIQDLKTMIKLVAYWIDSEMMTEQLLKDMPEPVKSEPK